MDYGCSSSIFHIELIMPDYKAIKGKPVLNIASDLDNAEGEGEIWFNTTSSDYKTIVKATGAWATGGNINTERRYLGSAGTQTAGIGYGGLLTPNSAVKDETEEYNGSSWTEVGDLNTGKDQLDGCGTQTAALAIGGRISGAVIDEVEKWNGTSWTEVGDINDSG